MEIGEAVGGFGVEGDRENYPDSEKEKGTRFTIAGRGLSFFIFGRLPLLVSPICNYFALLFGGNPSSAEFERDYR